MQGRTVTPPIDRKARLKIPAQHLPTQPAETRIHNWTEVCLGFDLETAMVEANRCLQCPAAPCVKACPLHNDIPGALWLLEQGDTLGAADVFRQTSNMPDICGRVCPQEKLCEGSCVVSLNGKNRPVQIGRLEQYCTDYQRETQGLPTPAVDLVGKPVAVVGAGPAGLAAAEELAKLGHPVTVFDGWRTPGGTLRYGIPGFKLDKQIVDAKLDQLETLGVKFVTETRLGDSMTIQDLFGAGFEAIFLGYGATKGNRLEIPGEDLPGVYSATEFLVRANLEAADLPANLAGRPAPCQKVVVIGGGDTAMDCVRSAVRLGAKEVTCVYRRSETEMPGRLEERTYAREEGVRFEYLAAPMRVLGEDGISGVEFVRMELGEPDDSGRRSVKPIAGTEFILVADTVVVATGYQVDQSVAGAVPGLEAQPSGVVVIDAETGATNIPGVFAGGDVVNGANLVVTAIAGGRRAAFAIHQYLEPEAPVS